MTHRVHAALLVSLIACSPGLALAQEDLDELMASDPDREEQASDDEGGGGDEGGGDEGGGDSEGWDESGVDDERPPGDPTAFALPKEKKDEDLDDEEDEDAAPPFGLGLLAGYGIAVSGEGNPWGVGMGLIGGYDLGLINVGVRFAYFLGETVSETIPSVGLGADRTVEQSINVWELGAELGLDIDASDKVLIRPTFGFGLASHSTGTTDAVLYVAPSAALLYAISSGAYLGFEMRFDLISGKTETISALEPLVHFGLRL